MKERATIYKRIANRHRSLSTLYNIVALNLEGGWSESAREAEKQAHEIEGEIVELKGELYL